MKDNQLVKYPRTPHVPQSPGATSDDKIMSKEVLKNFSKLNDFVVTEKLDGGNLTMTRDHFFARSLDSGTHLWDTRAKALWAEIRFEIPEGWRLSGESMYARRSVSYENLPSVFMIFGIWNDRNEMLSWDEIEEWAELIGLHTAPVLYRGADFAKACSIWSETMSPLKSEGFVVRNAESFHYDDFSKNVAKYVRADHVQTSAGWRGRDDFELNEFSD